MAEQNNNYSSDYNRINGNQTGYVNPYLQPGYLKAQPQPQPQQNPQPQPGQQYQQVINRPISPKKKSAMSKILLAVAIGLVFGLSAALGLYAVNALTGNGFHTPQTANANVDDLQKQVDDLQKTINGLNGQTLVSSDYSNTEFSTVVTDVTEVVEKVMPSMVSITNLYEENYSYWGRVYTQELEASGSGIIIGENDNELLLVTNNHVIENNVQLSIQFVDESQATAYVKGYDAAIDVAVLGVRKTDLSPETMAAIKVAVVGDSDSLKIGEPAIAIGNALGYGQSVTTGVISALHRDIDMENTWGSLIQTNAAINPGNSGGALLNIKGEVIGINSNKIGGSTVEGMGYAIPISDVKEVIETFMNRDNINKVSADERGYLGIGGVSVDQATAETYGIPAGVYVKKVYELSAAETAGISTGDVIIKIEGQSVTDSTQLQEILEYYKGGDTVTVTIMRAGASEYEEMEIEVTLGTK